MKNEVIEYRGWSIDFNVYGENEYTVQYEGDDVWFKTLDEAKLFVDGIAK